MFEQKARIGQDGGASAIIVENNEYDHRFIMASMTPKQDEADQKGRDDIRVPVIMVAKEHGEMIRMVRDRLATYERGGGGAVADAGADAHADADADADILGKMMLQVSVHKVQAPPPPTRPSAKSTAATGTKTNHDDDDWPQVKVGLTSVQVMGMGHWGAFLASPSGQDWQLYVIKRT